jgi:hypothetical protein
MPQLRVCLAPVAGLLLAARLASFLNRQSLVVESSLNTEDLRALLRNHTIVHIGGQHRGGTTLLLEGLASSPFIAVHDLRAATADAMRLSSVGSAGVGADLAEAARMAGERATLLSSKLHNEGIFLQDVYPKTSLDHQPRFFLRRRVARLACAAVPSLGDAIRRLLPGSLADGLLPWVSCRLAEGIGGYAFSGASRLGGDHPLADEAGALRLFSQWAPHWDMSRPVLLEKSPSNARAIGMLSAMWAAANAAGARFIFISRHPIAQALAMRAFIEPGDATLTDQLEHWLCVEEAIRDDARTHLRSAALLSLEGLAAGPGPALVRLLEWLGLPAEVDDGGDKFPRWADGVSASPNVKYVSAYREILKDLRGREEHVALVERFARRVADVSGYALGGPIDDFHNAPLRDDAWRLQWVGGHPLSIEVIGDLS